MKDCIRILLILTVMALLLSGCNAKNPEQTVPQDEQTTTAATDGSDAATEDTQSTAGDMELELDTLIPDDTKAGEESNNNETKPAEKEEDPTESIQEQTQPSKAPDEQPEQTEPSTEDIEPTESATEDTEPTESVKVPSVTNPDGSIQLPMIPG